mmetsp:Transcript_35266/g.77296  ORF Transcript_35266/g.77296 Transcript_35266/m.77296 type:complete len:970 (-) Transcript_35266:1260-4169(-)
MASAVSPYAPHRRSSSVSAAATGHHPSSATTGRVALLVLVLKYWNSDAIRRLRQLVLHYAPLRVPRCIAEVAESRLILVMRRESVLVLNRISSLVADTCRRLGLMDVRSLGGLLDNERPTTTRPLTSSSSRSTSRSTAVGNRVDCTAVVQNSCKCADRIRTNMQQIDSVLAYWFGSGSPNTSQKSLWMIDSSSVSKRRQVDADIDGRFGEILFQLLGGSNDERTGTCTSYTTVDGEDGLPVGGQLWKEWCSDVDLYGWRGKVAAIIILDQMSRHIRRNRDSNRTGMPAQHLFDKVAYNTSRLFRSEHEVDIQCGMVPVPMQIFALMPYRHASTICTVGIVQESVENIAALEKEVDGMVRRFRTATNRRMAVLQDEARREGKTTAVALEGEGGISDAAEEDLALTQKIFLDDNILENHAFDADMGNAEENTVVKTVVSFLSKVGIESYYPPGCEDPLANGAENKKCRLRRSNQTGDSDALRGLGPPKQRHVIVSLSGGVDSMVLASVLSYLCSNKRRGYQHLNVVSVHVDYGNRPESAAEASFVKKYSEENLNIPCTVRRIDEVTRGVTARDDYEKIARRIRFDMYRATSAQCMSQNTPTTPTASIVSSEDVDVVGVILGHHRGDLRENVLSNAHKGCGPLDLSGMTSVSRNDGVMIYRPLLPLEKDDILSYAHSYGVPYFKDTTPNWSTRGKLRNKLLPLLEEIYGEGSMSNLTGLAQESDEAKELVHRAVLGPIFDSVNRHAMGISFDTAPWKHQGPYFWKLALREILHSAGRGMFSDKSVLSFLERTRANKIKPGWLQMRKDYATFLREDGMCFILDPVSFPVHDRDKYDKTRLKIECGGSVEIGPWTVSATKESRDDWSMLERKKAIDSMEAFMSGHIRYYVKAPINLSASPPRLVFPDKFTKIGRPKAWKSSDLKIERTLPLVGADATAEDFAMLRDVSDGYGDTWCLVCVTLQCDAAKLLDKTD